MAGAAAGWGWEVLGETALNEEQVAVCWRRPGFWWLKTGPCWSSGEELFAGEGSALTPLEFVWACFPLPPPPPPMPRRWRMSCWMCRSRCISWSFSMLLSRCCWFTLGFSVEELSLTSLVLTGSLLLLGCFAAAAACITTADRFSVVGRRSATFAWTGLLAPSSLLLFETVETAVLAAVKPLLLLLLLLLLAVAAFDVADWRLKVLLEGEPLLVLAENRSWAMLLPPPCLFCLPGCLLLLTCEESKDLAFESVDVAADARDCRCGWLISTEGFALNKSRRI